MMPVFGQGHVVKVNGKGPAENTKFREQGYCYAIMSGKDPEFFGEEWMTSAEVEKAAKISSCNLMHLRLEGVLAFKKRGNAYLYHRKDVERLKRKGERT